MVACSAPVPVGSTSHLFLRSPFAADSTAVRAHHIISSRSFTPLSSASSSTTRLAFPNCQPSNSRPNRRLGSLGLTRSSTALSREVQGEHDPELRLVLELATDAELYELERILFGPSYFSPLIKSLATTKRDLESEYIAIGEDLEERESFISLLESRFLFLAADARSTLRGWRPSYRGALLAVRKKLKIPCSSKLATEDLEVEIFLHLLQDYSSEESETLGIPSENVNTDGGGLELGLSQWKVLTSSALKGGAEELKSMFFKGGTMLTLGRIYQMLSRRLTGKLFIEAANYQMKNEIIKKGGQLAAINLESRVALQAAKQGLAGAATRYLGLRTLVSFLGPVMWGTLLADVVIQMLGTDYARVVRAIYAFAQIRIMRTYKLPSDDS